MTIKQDGIETLDENSTADIENPTVNETLEQVLFTQKELDEIKENLNKMIDAMAHNPSIISRAATYWGELPLWQKIVAGVVLTVPAFVFAIVAQIAVLLSLSIFALVIYTAGSILLDEHHNHTVSSTENLKECISSLATTLGTVILALDTLRQQLAGQIEQLQIENEQLGNHVEELGDQIKDLVQQVDLLKATEKALRKTQTELEQLSQSLQTTVEEHTELLLQNEEQLAEVTQNYEKAEIKLSVKIAELDQVKIDLGEQIKQGQVIANTMSAASVELLGVLSQDKEMQKAYLEKLEVFLNDKETSFHLVATRICEAEKQLAVLKDEYQRLNQKHELLLQRSETQIDRLSQIPSPMAQTSETTPAKALQKFGLYSVDTKQTVPPAELQKLNTASLH